MLTREGDHFAIDGRGEFLLFVSYFDGLNRPPAVLQQDLAWLAGAGIRGIRVWPNSPPVPLMHPAGTLNAAMLNRLVRLVDKAARHRIAVDVTFHREAIDCQDTACEFTIAAYGAALAQATRALSPYRNVLIDLQNEWNDHRMDMSWPDIESLHAQVRAADPVVPITASVTSTYGEEHAAGRAFDLLAYHDGRDAYGSWASDTEALVQRLRDALMANGQPMPIYLQEPNRFPHPGDRQPNLDDTPEHYWLAAQAARRAGAAAWTFHTAASFDLSSDVPFAHLLLAPERRVISGLRAAVAEAPVWGVQTPVTTRFDLPDASSDVRH